MRMGRDRGDCCYVGHVDLEGGVGYEREGIGKEGEEVDGTCCVGGNQIMCAWEIERCEYGVWWRVGDELWLLYLKVKGRFLINKFKVEYSNTAVACENAQRMLTIHARQREPFHLENVAVTSTQDLKKVWRSVMVELSGLLVNPWSGLDAPYLDTRRMCW